MDVLLIQPEYHRKRNMPPGHGLMPPTMLLYLAKPLIEKGFYVDILDLMTYSINEARFKEYVRTYGPRIVGITATTENYSVALRMAQAVKEAVSETHVVIGGPHVTFEADDALSHACIDLVVRGEGDVVFRELVEHLLLGRGSLAQIGSLSYRHNGNIIHNEQAPLADVDELSFPTRDHVNLSRYVIPGAVLSSRGCPFRCRFCTAAAMAGGKYRLRSTESIAQEIDYLVRQVGVSYLAFLDDTITGIPERTKQVCQHIVRSGYEIRWLCESRVDVADTELLRLMAQAGCHQIQFGFESANEGILRSIRKFIKPAQMEEAVRRCVLLGIVPSGNFMIGFPDDTRETIEETVQMACRLKRMGAYCDIAVLTPFPGTFFHRNADDLGLRIHSRNTDDFVLDHPIISTKHLSREELDSIYSDARTRVYDL